ncbi:MAG: DNA-processing protein DprA [Candidatus Marinimicrobia bacterium]|nr:DNA-processing protein DprA [Candidatus Neomarinimicrobiota bacterium]
MFPIKDILSLLCIDGIGPKTYFQLLSKFGSPRKILEADSNELIKIPRVNQAITKQITSHSYEKCVEIQLDWLKYSKAKIVTYWDDDYPEILKFIFDPPILLFYYGELSKDDKFSLAVVGNRHPDEYGKRITKEISESIAEKKITIISGMARGIDSIAHYSAINKNSRTIAVLGTSLDTIYPAENRSLMKKIIQNGAVISEFLIGKKMVPGNFVMRNRIIAGLSRGVVVTQAGDKSGALITAYNANTQNREVFAIPGNILNSRHKGCHRLLKTGAKLVESFEDIISEFPQIQKKLEKQINWVDENAQNVQMTDVEKKIIKTLTKDAMHVDDIVFKSECSHLETMNSLLNLEMKGYVKQLPGKYYIRSI